MDTEVPSPTARIRFRCYRSSDASAVEEIFSDPLARRFYPEIVDRQASEAWIQWSLASYDSAGCGLWVIEHAQTGEFLGDCGLTYQTVEDERLLELGYHLGSPHRGNGYASEAGRACIDFAFDTLRAESVCSIVSPDNRPSITVSQRLHDCCRTFVSVTNRDMLLFWTDRQSA